MRLKIIIPIVISGEIRHTVMRSLLDSVRPAPGTELSIETLPSGTFSIEGRADLALNQGAVMEAARRAQAEGFDGVFVSDMDMCGVEPARESLDIPIVGGFSPNVFTALTLGHRLGLVTISHRVVPMQRDHFRTFGIESSLASVRVAPVAVAELIDDPRPAAGAVFEQACQAVDDGAEVIVLGCTGFIGIADAVAERLARSGRPVPVLDPNRTAVSFLEHLVRSRLSHSRTAYPREEVLYESNQS